MTRCQHCSFSPESSSDYCDVHRPRPSGWQSCGLPWATHDGSPCFVGLDEIKQDGLTGVLVEIADKHSATSGKLLRTPHPRGIVLIGTWNELRGVCDCCTEDHNADFIVTRWQRVWWPGKESL